jgi:hypothetical protein
MWTPTQWRCDGEWGTKRRRRLYPLLPDQIMADKPIHSGSTWSRRVQNLFSYTA